MDGGVYSTNNKIVDQCAKVRITGNIIPQVWYKTIVRENGKPNLTAIIILADIVYWYKPTEVRDEGTGQVVSMKKKFKADLLQRSYQQISEEFGISKKEATNAVVALEKLGVIQREFRTVNINGLIVNNVLFIELVIPKLYELTYPKSAGIAPIPFKGDRRGSKEQQIQPERYESPQVGTNMEPAPHFKSERLSPCVEGTVTKSAGEQGPLSAEPDISCRDTNTEITQKNLPEEDTNQILSYQHLETSVKKQIDYDAICIDRPGDKNQLDDIVAIMMDVLTSTARTIRINREEKLVKIVQIVYRKLDKQNVEFVLDSLQSCGTKATNIRALILTTLYNAAMTTASFYTNLYAHHEARSQP